MGTVTFDSNTLENVIDPERSQAIPFKEDYLKIQEAIKGGKLKGYFSDTWITIEGISSANRGEIFGSRHLVSKDKTNSPDNITITFYVEGKINRLHKIPSQLKSAAFNMGMRALKGPIYLGNNFILDGDDRKLYRDISTNEMANFAEKASKAQQSIYDHCLVTHNNVGREKAYVLGLEYLEREGISSSSAYWFSGFKFAKDSREKELVSKAVAEWSDGESIIRHIGHGIDLFCTLDDGKNAGISIFDTDHRKWLTNEHGVVFCKPHDLAILIK